jgi:hypothetical protein
MTLFSAVGYLPRWAKYTLLPDFLRFLWWLVWVRVCAVAHVIHRAAVLQGALRQIEKTTFSRSKQFHSKFKAVPQGLAPRRPPASRDSCRACHSSCVCTAV